MIGMNKKYKWVFAAIAIMICSAGAALFFLRQSTIRTWDIQKGLMLIFFVGAIITCLMGCIVKNKKWSIVSLCVVVVTLLTWTYYSNPIDNTNDRFTAFQQDSDTLVYSRLEAQNKDVSIGKYGLGRYSDILSVYSYHAYKTATPISTDDGSVNNGYSTTFPGIVVVTNDYTQNTFVVGNQIRFSSGEQMPVIAVEATDIGLFVKVDSTQCLSKETEGDIKDIVVYNAEGEALPVGLFSDYKSSVGAQGFLFSILAKITAIEPTVIFPFVCSLLFAIVVVCFLFLLQKKYNSLMAICFFFVFWLSPWVVNFANSEYWLQFTWLLPSVFGLILSIWRDHKTIRWIGYGGVFLSILLKCLCGYEYLSFIMLGVIFYLLVDMFMCVVEKDWKTFKKLFSVTVCAGIVALLGFIVVLFIHGALRGDGNVLEGIQRIWQQDVLRRTFGGNADNYAEAYRASIEASLIDVLRKYIVFPTSIMVGVPGHLFALLCIVPILIFMWNASIKQNVMWKDMALYAIAFFSSLSWLVLGKQHSYIHVVMNYICWYYWLIPMCIYIIVKQLYLLIAQKKDVEI